MLSKIKDYRLKKEDYITSVFLAAFVLLALCLRTDVIIEKVTHLVPGALIFFFFMKFLLSTPLAEKNFDKRILVIFWFCFFYYLIYIFFSSIYTKGTDVGGHMRYITYFFNGEFPKPNSSWQTYHPPLFHLLATPFLFLGKWLGLEQPFEMVRYFSLMSYMVFLFYSVMLFRLILNNRVFEHIALLLLVLWPIGVIFSAKLNNDILIYSTVTAGLYYLTSWYKNNDTRHLWYAVNIGLLAVMAKTTGLLFCLLAFVCVAIKILRKEMTIPSIFGVKKSLIVFTIIFSIISFSSNFGRTLYHNFFASDNQNFIAGNLEEPNEFNWNAGFIKDDNYKYYTSMDLELYFSEPFVVLFSYDHEERKYIWNTFIKSSITGVGDFSTPYLLQMMNSTYLFMLIYVLLGYVAIVATDRSSISKALTPLFLMPIICLSAMLYMRSIFHLTGYAQSRFCHYIIPILIILLLKAIDYHKQKDHRILYNMGLMFVGALGFMFFIFMLSQFSIS